jgi:hypothetical protein
MKDLASQTMNKFAKGGRKTPAPSVKSSVTEAVRIPSF